MAGSGLGRAGRLALYGVLVFGAAACAKPPVVEVYPQVEEYSGREIDEVNFRNTEPFSEDSLDALTETEPTKCRLLGFLPFCFPGTDWGLRRGHLDLGTLGSDLARLNLLYRQSGYFGTEVRPEIDEPGGDDAPIELDFVVRRGDGIIVDSVVVEGTEGIADPDSLEAILPLQPGELFHIGKFVASADTVRRALYRQGHAYAEILRNYAVDTIQDRATAWLVSVPGPRVVIDSILIQGLEALDRGTTLRHATIEQGSLLELRRLASTQRNLYDLELVQFATVSVAPDSLQLTPADSTSATVLIQLVEAPEHVVETSLGYGTIDCGRATAQWTDRSFLWPARRLSLTGSLSRIGVGEPTAWAGGSLCDAANDTVATALDYRIAGEFRQPYFITPRNQLTLGAWVERQSEPGLYERTAQGTRFNLSHRLGIREALTATIDAERRVTRAVPALYCQAFLVCQPEDIEALGEPRWLNSLGASWLRDRGNSPVDPTSGYVVRAAAQWATPLLASTYDFVRATTDGALYRPVRPGWVLAGRLRLGSFLGDAGIRGDEDFIPPEERFFAGGATTVRGFTRNELSPGLWIYHNDENVQPEDLDPDSVTIRDVSFVPTGGTSVVVANLELRLPSPVLSDFARMAVFIDAGTVGLEPVWRMQSNWFVTPGAGLRIRTPVGPARIDLAYNPYPRRSAPLYVPDPDTNALERIDDDYQPEDPTFWQRFRIQVAVGQAF